MADYNPLAGQEHPHLVYQHESDYPEIKPKCLTSGNVAKVIAKRTVESENTTRVSNETKELEHNRVKELHVEIMVTLDHAILNYHKSLDIENYVLTVFNMVRI